METQFNFQLKQRKDTTEWENIKVFYKTHCDRTTAVGHARNLSELFRSEVRLTEGAEPLKMSGTYIYEVK
ncbi:addiction module toxin RelE [Chryseobacterium sp.]|uniref:addiction module toxin RelE n=1 Tax=Chryseobacterium sp. TaxID=1871047 RepID=UPI0031D84006